MKPDIQIIDPTKYPGWDDLILSHPDYSFFHSSAWAEVLFKSYGYIPLYFTVLEDGRLLALLPFMEVNSFLTGRRGVCLPFTDYCPPAIDGEVSFEEIFNFALDYGKKNTWRTLELRGVQENLNVETSEVYLGHTLFLEKGEQSLYKGLRDSTKRNIKKAKAEGVEVRISDQPESIDQFYSLNSVTRKRHGLPSQPFFFFKNVLQLVIKKGHGFVVLGLYEGKAIAASVFFHLGKKAVYKYGASDLTYQHLRANNLVMWEAIKRYAQDGYKSLCFGRTEPENQGLIQFKSGWGTTEQQINYYRYDFKKEAFVSGISKVTGFHNKIFRRMPNPLLKTIGSVLYKHVG
jgi:hypothetical protein